MEKGYSPVVPPKSNRTDPREYDKERYKQRNEMSDISCVLSDFGKYLPVTISLTCCSVDSSTLL